MRESKVINLPSNAKSAELEGQVTIGEESAAKLNSIGQRHPEGREYRAGDVINLGTVAYYHKNPIKRLWGSVVKIRPHIFSDKRMEAS